MATEQTATIPTRDKEEAAQEAAQEAPQEPPKAEINTKVDNDEPLDPAKYIEAHILPRLDKDVVDYYLNEIVKKATTRQVTMEYIRSHPDEFRNLIAVDTSEFPRVKDYTLQSEKDKAEFPVRVYHPDPAEHGPGPYPVHLNFHGGGFVLGDLHTEAQLCLNMREAGVVVVDVNYRHCPETLWGKCFEDAWAALVWVRSQASELNIKADSLSVGGISAGGQITIVLHIRAAEEGVPLRLAMPTVPPSAGCLFYRYWTDSPFKSFHEFNRSPILPWARIKYFADVSLDSVPDDVAGVVEGDSVEVIHQKRKDALYKLWPVEWLVPLDAPKDKLKGLAPAYVRTGEMDNLRDEGEAYGHAVVAAGGQVTFKRYPGGVHSFMYLDFNKQKRAYDIDSIVALRQGHGFAALPQDEVEKRVDRVAAVVKAKQAKEKEAREAKKKAEGADGKGGDSSYA